MEKAIIVRGKMNDSRHIELDEPVADVRGDVELVLRSVAAPPPGRTQDLFKLVAQLSPGARSKEEIDRQVREERASWGDR